MKSFYKPRVTAVIAVSLYILVVAVACGGSDKETTLVWDLKPEFAARPAADTVLRVSGKINKGDPAYFSLEQLMALPAREFSSFDPWLETAPLYTGFELYPFLESLDIAEDAERLILSASNEYAAEISLGDIKKYRYLVTYAEEGRIYSELEDERNKSPLSVAVKHEDYPELEMELLKLNYVWWLVRIEVQ